MEEIYWITRLDSIQWTLGFINFISIIGVLIGFGGYSCVTTDHTMSNNPELRPNDYKENQLYHNLFKRFLKIFLPLLIISSLGKIFIPDTKEAYAIYGIGGTIDYIRNDSTAVQLPHKCIEAIDLWINNKINEDD